MICVSPGLLDRGIGESQALQRNIDWLHDGLQVTTAKQLAKKLVARIPPVLGIVDVGRTQTSILASTKTRQRLHFVQHLHCWHATWRKVKLFQNRIRNFLTELPAPFIQMLIWLLPLLPPSILSQKHQSVGSGSSGSKSKLPGSHLPT